MKKVGLILCATLFMCGCNNSNENKNYIENIKKIDCNEKTILVESGAILIDVRSKGEFEEKHIEGAINIEYGIIKNEISSITDKKDSKLIVYCQSGRRSEIAANTLASMGYSNVYDLGAIDNCQTNTDSNN